MPSVSGHNNHSLFLRVYLTLAGPAADEGNGDSDEVVVDGLCVAAVRRDVVGERHVLNAQARLERATEPRRDAVVDALHHGRRRCQHAKQHHQ